jgi:hypothetical protein
MKIIGLILLSTIVLISACTHQITGNEIENGQILLHFNFDEIIELREVPLEISIKVSQSGSVSFEGVTSSIDKFLISGLEYGEYTIFIEMSFAGKNLYSSESMGIILDGIVSDVQVKVVNAFIKYDVHIDTNPAETNDVHGFYNYSVDGRFFKKHEIPNVEQLADEYLTTPLIYFINHSVYSNLDENMIPVVQYSIGDYYNPVTSSQTATAFYRDYIENGNSESLTGFLNNADWLIDNMDSDGYLHYEFDWHHDDFELSAPWISAMAQGQALAVMCMAYHFTADDVYLSAASKLYITLKSNNDEFWSVGIDEEDYIWFEEYPNEGFCHVLNGSLFTLWGLWDYYCVTKNVEVLELFEGGIKSILDNFYYWNRCGENGSNYCANQETDFGYHSVHITQFEKYRDFFDIQEFDDLITIFCEH